MSIEGCNSVSSTKLIDCNPAGGDAIKIYGSYFSPFLETPPQVMISGYRCSVLNGFTSTHIVCTAPSAFLMDGVVTDLPVTATSFGHTIPCGLISYDGPSFSGGIVTTLSLMLSGYLARTFIQQRQSKSS